VAQCLGHKNTMGHAYMTFFIEPMIFFKKKIQMKHHLLFQKLTTGEVAEKLSK
jgi:hypothetical protein